MGEKKKPPLGLMPKRIHDEQRLDLVKEAIYRRLHIFLTIPPEWIVEYNQLIEELERQE